MATGYKTGGRSKGTPNKTTFEIRQMLTDILVSNIDTLQTDLSSLEPKERVKYLIDLSKLILPQLKQEDTNTKFVEQPLFYGIDLNIIDE
jgi:hypothetical protein